MLFVQRTSRAVCLAAALALVVAGCSPPEASPEPPPSPAPSSRPALPVPTTTAQVLTVAAEALRTASYRFTVDYAVPAHLEHTLERPDCEYHMAGHTDAAARIARAVTHGGGRCGLDVEELVITSRAWVRKREGDVPWSEWVEYHDVRLMQDFTPWLIAERLNNAVDVAGTMTEVRGRIDLTVPVDVEETRLAGQLLGHLGVDDESDVGFTLTLGTDSRPASFAFELPFNEGVLAVAFTFTEYGLGVNESPPADLRE